MDESVRRALLRWPDVPACNGWLGLDARGDWWMRSEAARPWPREADGRLQRAGASRLRHPGLVAFIARNYQSADDGHWYFQNGPQRVYVELEAAPLVLRLQPDRSWRAHTGAPCVPRLACVDAAGRLYLDTDVGPGIVHTLDMSALGDWLDDALTRLQPPDGESLELLRLDADALCARLGFRPRPSADLPG